MKWMEARRFLMKRNNNQHSGKLLKRDMNLTVLNFVRIFNYSSSKGNVKVTIRHHHVR